MPTDYDDAAQDDDYNLCVLNALPVAYWPMGENTGTFADITGNGHDATVTDAVKLTYNSAALVETDPATVGPFSAIGAVGTNDQPQVQVPHDGALNAAAAFSVECWIKPTHPASPTRSDGNLYHKIGTVAGQSDGFLVGIGGGNSSATFRFSARAFTTAGGYVANLTTAVYTYDAAYHVVFRVDPNGHPSFVVNGLIAAVFTGFDSGHGTTTTPIFHAGFTTTAIARIACKGPAALPGGIAPHTGISHLAYYDYYLSDGMCVQHYAQGKTAFGQTDAVVTQPRLFTVYPAGTDDPYATEPVGWETPAFDDTLWSIAVVMTHNNDPSDGDRQIPILTPAVVPAMPSHAVWLTDDNIGEQPETDRLLFRLPFTLTGPVSAATVYYNPDNDLDLYVNGTLLLSDVGSSTPYATNTFYTLTAPDLALFAAGANLLAARVTNAGTTPAAFAGPVGFFLWLEVTVAEVNGAYSWIQVW